MSDSSSSPRVSIDSLGLSPVDPEPILDTFTFRVHLECQMNSVMMIVAAAYESVTSRRIHVLHGFTDGFYVVDENREIIDRAILNKIEEKINIYKNDESTVKIFTCPREELTSYYRSIGHKDKVALLNILKDKITIKVAKIENYIDIIYSPIETDLKKLNFSLKLDKENEGFFVICPTLLSNGKINEEDFEEKEPKEHRLMTEFGEWAGMIHSNSMTEINEIVKNDRVPDIDSECINFNKKELNDILENLENNFPQKRLITIAGPSSSGKSQFSKLLFNELKAKGYDCLVVSMDNFYKMRTNIPCTPDGLKDFECIEAFEVERLRDHLLGLLSGKEVPEHKYSFVTGLNWDTENTLKVDQKGFLILEGIHGLNPQLLNAIGADVITKIYVAPMTPVSIDLEHIFPQSDLRLIRRIIRDAKSRGYPARASIRQWTSVRIGEERNISPNIEGADLFFNSSCVYELPVLSALGLPLLETADQLLEDDVPGSDNVKEINGEVERLIRLLSLMRALPPKRLPKSSSILEFME